MAGHRALARAWEAGGDVFSAHHMIEVRDLLEQSRNAYDAGDFLTARLLAERATADARLARAVTQSERERFNLNVMLSEIQAHRDTINLYRHNRILLEQEISPTD